MSILKISGVALIAAMIAPMANAQGMDEEIAAIRAATAKYKDVNVALAEGFIPDPSGACVSAAAEGLPAEWGAMGIHYLNPGRLGITGGEPRVNGNGTNVDFTAPSILMYEPQADGSLQLLGVENLVFKEGWAAAGNSMAPTFAGKMWDSMADDPNTAGDEAHMFEAHFDLHVWSERENPAGATTPFNPMVNCDNAG